MFKIRYLQTALAYAYNENLQTMNADIYKLHFHMPTMRKAYDARSASSSARADHEQAMIQHQRVRVAQPGRSQLAAAPAPEEAGAHSGCNGGRCSRRPNGRG